MSGKKSSRTTGYIGYVFRRGWGDVPEVIGRKSGEFDYATYEEVRAAVLRSEINDLCHIAERVLALLGTSTHEEFRQLELGTGSPTRDWRRADEAAVRSAAAALLDSLKVAAPTSECWKDSWPVPRGLLPSPAPEPAGLPPSNPTAGAPNAAQPVATSTEAADPRDPIPADEMEVQV